MENKIVMSSKWQKEGTVLSMGDLAEVHMCAEPGARKPIGASRFVFEKHTKLQAKGKVFKVQYFWHVT